MGPLPFSRRKGMTHLHALCSRVKRARCGCRCCFAFLWWLGAYQEDMLSAFKELPLLLQGPLQAPPLVKSHPRLLLSSRPILHPWPPFCSAKLLGLSEFSLLSLSGAFVPCSLVRGQFFLLPLLTFFSNSYLKYYLLQGSLPWPSPTPIHAPSWLAAPPEGSIALYAYTYVKCGLSPYTFTDCSPYARLRTPWGSHLSWHPQTCPVCEKCSSNVARFINDFLQQLYHVTQLLPWVDNPFPGVYNPFPWV